MGWFGPTAEEIRAKEAREAAELETAVKNGTAGRVVNDPAEQKAVREFRKKQAELEKQRKLTVATLEARRKLADEFQRQQEIQEKSVFQFNHKQPPKNLGAHDRPEVIAVKNKMKAALPYRGELGLFRNSKNENEAVLVETRVERKKM